MRMKRTIALILALLIMATLLSACKNEKTPDPTSPTTNVIITPSAFTASTYLIDSWRNDLEDGSREYFITLLMYSNDYYAAPASKDVQYLTSDGYKPLEEAIDGAEVSLYQMNKETKKGVFTYAKIKTPKLIDVKKIYTLLAGPSQYDEQALTQEDYKNKYGNLDEWRALLTSVSTKTPPISSAKDLQATIGYGVVRMFNKDYSLFNYNKCENSMVIEGSKKTVRFDIDMLQDNELDAVAVSMAGASSCVNFVNGKAEKAELDKRLKICSSIVDGYLVLGFETVDGSDFAEYDGDVPDAIIYSYDITSYFMIN